MNPWPHGWVGLREGSRGADKTEAEGEPHTLGKPKQHPSTLLLKAKSAFEHLFERYKHPRTRGKSGFIQSTRYV